MDDLPKIYPISMHTSSFCAKKRMKGKRLFISPHANDFFELNDQTVSELKSHKNGQSLAPRTAFSTTKTNVNLYFYLVHLYQLTSRSPPENRVRTLLSKHSFHLVSFLFSECQSRGRRNDIIFVSMKLDILWHRLFNKNCGHC